MRTIIRNNYDPKTSDYHETLVIDDALEKKYLFDCDGVFTDVTNPKVVSESGNHENYAASQKWVTEIEGDLADEIQNRTDADGAIWEEIESIEAASDVVDVVGTYAELEDYDTSKLHDNDLIKVLQDETHDDVIAYYRWSTSTDTFSYVGAEGPYYTESQIDTMMAAKQDKALKLLAAIAFATPEQTYWAFQTGGNFLTFTEIANAYDEKTILVSLIGESQYYKVVECSHTSSTAQLVMTDGTKFITFTYVPNPGPVQDFDNRTFTRSVTNVYSSAFTGATASADGVQGLVPGPLAGDQDKVLKGDGTWGDAAAITTFYLSSFIMPPDSSVALYKDAACTSRASVVDVLNVLKKGQVYLCSPDMTGDYLNYFSVTGYSADKIASSTYSVDIVIEGIFNEAVWMDSKPLVYELTFVGQTGSADTFSLADCTPLTSIPTASSSTLGGIKVGSNLSITSGILSAKTMVGATASSNGAEGYVPQPFTSDKDKFLKGDGTWAKVNAGYTEFTISSGYDIGDEALASITLDNGTWMDVLDSYLDGNITRIQCIVQVGYTPKYNYYDVIGYQDTTGKLVLAGKDGGGILVGATSSATAAVTHVVIPVLYGTTGQNTDGAVTQKYFTQVVGDIETILQILNHGSGV